MTLKYTLIVLAFLGSLPATVAAQRHHHEEHEYKNEVAVFLGVTTETISAEVDRFFTFGAEYEYRFLPRLGISAEIEYVTDAESTIFVFPAVIHAYHGLMFLVGPGWATDTRVLEARGKESSFLVRTGVQYAFHLGSRYSIIPSVDLDFVRETELEFEPPGHGEAFLVETIEWGRVVVWGVKFGISF